LWQQENMPTKATKTTTAKDQQPLSPLKKSLTINLPLPAVAAAVQEHLNTQHVKESVLHLAGNYEAMKNLCANYGLAAALILTMAFANYSSLDADAWMHYQRVWMTSEECQVLARQSCNSTIKVTDQTRLGGTGLRSSAWTQGAEYYCTDVFHEWTMKDGGNPFLSFKGTDKECCAATIKCAMVSSWNLEASFIAGNGAGSMLLLMTVLYATLLHIVVQGTVANPKKDDEIEMVQKNLQIPFLFLHILFFVGLGFAFFGLIAVMSIRISTPFFSAASYGIGLGGAALASTLILVSFCEVLKVNRYIFKNQKKKKEELEKQPKEVKEQDEKKKEVVKKEEELKKALEELMA